MISMDKISAVTTYRLASIVLVMLTLVLPCYAQEIQYDQKPEQQEIYLNINAPSKQYNLKKTDYRNNPDMQQYDDDEKMPIEFMTSPLRILKQYQNDEL